MVVFVADEPRHATHPLPTIFDWTVVEEACRYSDEHGITRLPIELITGTGSIGSRIPEHRYPLLQAVQARSPHAIEYIPERQYTGGVYRDAIARRAHGVIALGGGKGVTALYEACGSTTPFVPVNTNVGRPPGDEVYDKGSRRLWNRALTEPEVFFRFTTNELRRSSLLLNLVPSSASAEDIARTCVRLLWGELAARAETSVSEAAEGRGGAVAADASSYDLDATRVVVHQLALVFSDAEDAVSLATAAGFSRSMLPAFKTSLLFWEEVARHSLHGDPRRTPAHHRQGRGALPEQCLLRRPSPQEPRWRLTTGRGPKAARSSTCTPTSMATRGAPASSTEDPRRRSSTSTACARCPSDEQSR